MNTKNRTVRAGLATVALAAALAAFAGPASAEVPLTPTTTADQIATSLDSGSSALTSGSAAISNALFPPVNLGCPVCS
ncbi:hypothetical protein ACWEOI_26225 [Nocardia sp. NPDC004340]|uniref:hypothetical protein n=1 Tax=Nocardia sp. CA-136227 TaxID=3239979 RepID=UPI003D958222